jgi:transketolase
MSVDELLELGRRVRVEVVKAIAAAGGGHAGASLSAADLLVTLYFAEMNVRPADPAWPDRDRFVLSKGHAALALYATLGFRGYFPIDELGTFGHLDSRFQGHPDMTRLRAIDISTGALGAGLSAAVGMALGCRLRGTGQRTYVLLGDGECQEGEVWEAAFIAGRYRLDNLVAIVDLNGFQVTGWPGPEPGTQAPPWPADALAAQWAASGWRVEHIDGHDPGSILDGLDKARQRTGTPVVLIAHTVKGKGVSFMRGWHSRAISPEELERALEELRETR